MSETLQFDGRVVVITGSGNGLGASYARLFASRGAKVLVNDINSVAADAVVRDIKARGGEAIADNHSVVEGQLIIKTATDAWSRVDVLINNAGNLRNASFADMTQEEWDAVYQVHLKGAFIVTKAVWPIMRKQKYGRIINISSAAGLYGSAEQINYAACKFGLMSFAKTLAAEGAKYNIHANAVAPYGASAMTVGMRGPRELQHMSPDLVAPVVAYLCHESCKDSGIIIETGAGHVSQTRWEASKGVIFRTDDTFTPSAVAARFDEIIDYRNARHPLKIVDDNLKSLNGQSANAPPNPQGPKIDLRNQVAIITGAGGGIGKGYAKVFSKHGAKIVVNDMNKANADAVVEEIKAAGGEAVANYSSVEDGQALIDTALKAFGGVHILVNNAGILRDKSFAALTEAEWDIIYNVHLKGTYATCKAVWPIFLKQKYGRILNTASLVCIHGNFGQANYSTCKGAIIGLTKSLAIQGAAHNILANSLLPTAASQLTATVWNPEMMKVWLPEYNAPLVGFVCSPANTSVSGDIFHTTGGGVGAYRWQKSFGHAFPVNTVTLENVAKHWNDICRFDEKAWHPKSGLASILQMEANFGNVRTDSFGSNFDSQDSELVSMHKAIASEATEFAYTHRDVILYNLGLGAEETDLHHVYELHPKFQVVGAFGVLPLATAYRKIPPSWLPNFNYGKLLHGEQYLKIHNKIPTTATLINTSKILEVLDKGKAAVINYGSEARLLSTGELLFSGSTTLFIRDAGGFGGKSQGSDMGPITAPNIAPKRKPDHVKDVKTDKRQAAVYRLSGDWNPLHIDPERSKVGGFKMPILHGLCFFGIAFKAISDVYGDIQDIKVRFSGHFFPGETLRVSMWKEDNRVVFTAQCVERNTVVLSNAAVTLF